MEWIDALTVFMWFAPEIVFIFGVLFIASAICVFYAVWEIYYDSIDTEETSEWQRPSYLIGKTPFRNCCIKKRRRMTMERQRYYAEKEQLLERIDSLLRNLAYLQQTGPAECILCLTNQLEVRLKELSALRQTITCRRRRHK